MTECHHGLELGTCSLCKAGAERLARRASQVEVVERGAPAGRISPADAVAQVEEPRRRLTQQALQLMVDRGCWIEIPNSARHDYLNIQPPSSHGGGRVCSVNRSTGRLEFQADSHAFARELELGATFDRLIAGDKAAISLASDGEIEAVGRLFAGYLASRRGVR